jgi:hypothetical protein
MADSALITPGRPLRRPSLLARAREGVYARSLGWIEVVWLVFAAVAGIASLWPAWQATPLSVSATLASWQDGEGDEASGDHREENGALELTRPATAVGELDPSLQPVLLNRIERLGLVLLAACGTIAIGWICLLLDHQTRHHFSRRFQTLAVLAWLVFAALVVWVFAGLLA